MQSLWRESGRPAHTARRVRTSKCRSAAMRSASGESPETCCGGQLTRGVSLGDAFLWPLQSA
jgi:hypothetical protein